MAVGNADISLLGKIAGYTEILSKDPHSTVFVPLSEAYRTMGMLDEAIDVARRGIDAVPGYAPGYITLGRSLAEQGQLKDAAEAFSHALQTEEANLQAIKGLARVKLLLGQPEEARPLLMQGRQLAPDDGAIVKMLATIEAARPAVSPTPQAPTLQAAPPQSAKRDVPIATATVAEIYERQGLFKKAFKVYHDLYQADPQNQQLREKLLDLKRRIQAGEGAPAQAAPAPAAPTVAVASAPPEDVSPPPPPIIPTPTPEQELADTYARWLDAIQIRRHHV